MQNKVILVVALAFVGLLLGAAAVTAHGFGMRGGSKMGTMHQEMEKAFETGDLNAVKKMHEKYGMGGKELTEEQFKLMAQMHEAMEDGDYGKMEELRQQLPNHRGCPMMG